MTRDKRGILIRRFPFPPFPNSWFVVAFSSDLPARGVLPMHYFGREMVLFRTDDGVARVFDAYCPHLGAHLGCGGVVQGNHLRCPFHGWRFDGESGQCSEVPHATKIPPRAGVRNWPVREMDGVIFVYHHTKGLPPTWEVPSLHGDEWTEPAPHMWKLFTCPQEIIENTVDTTHFVTVHQTLRPADYRPRLLEGPIVCHEMEQLLDGIVIDQPGTEVLRRFAISLHGLGSICSDAYEEGDRVQGRQRFFATPIDEDHIHLRITSYVRKLPDAELTKALAEGYHRSVADEIAKDFPVWENKIYHSTPMLSDADGPIMTIRRWARQFY